MHFLRAKSRFFVLLSVSYMCTGIAWADSLPPLWTPVGGTDVTGWNSMAFGDGFYTVNIPFEFPLFGQNYNSATLASNGIIYFGTAPATPQPGASSTTGFTQGDWASIAPAWYNIQAIPSLGGSGTVSVDTYTDHVVITFDAVGSYPAPVAASNQATFQVTLDSDGSVIFGYDALNSLDPAATGVPNSLSGSAEAIAGITSGMGTPDPGSIDFSALARI